jgi:hypothetical protein
VRNPAQLCPSPAVNTLWYLLHRATLPHPYTLPSCSSMTLQEHAHGVTPIHSTALQHQYPPSCTTGPRPDTASPSLTCAKPVSQATCDSAPFERNLFNQAPPAVRADCHPASWSVGPLTERLTTNRYLEDAAVSDHAETQRTRCTPRAQAEHMTRSSIRATRSNCLPCTGAVQQHAAYYTELALKNPSSHGHAVNCHPGCLHHL